MWLWKRHYADQFTKKIMMREDNVEDRLASEAPAMFKRPPRSERKRKRHEELLLQKRENRKKKKIKKKLREKEGCHELGSEDRKNKKERKEEIQKRLCVAMETGQRICIDCGLEEYMIDKEKTKLAMQIGRVYGSNRRADNPVHLYISGIDKCEKLYQECVRINDGFQNYFMDICEQSHTELFSLDSLIYLIPDSDNLLKDIDSTKIYVIGGLVDESIKRK